MAQPGFIERIRANLDRNLPAVAAGLRSVLPNAERTTDVVRLNTWDRRVWEQARKTKPIDDMVTDLYIGDTHRGGDREAVEESSELVKSVFSLLYKANASLTPKRHLDRNLHGIRRIAEELQGSPMLEHLHEFTFSDEVMTTMAVKTMEPVLHEILTRVPPPEPPPEPAKPKPDKQEGEQDQQEQEQEQSQPGDGEPQEGEQEQGEGEGEGQGEGQDQQEGGQEQGESQAPSDDWDFDAEADAAESAWEDEYDQGLDQQDIDRLLHQALMDAVHDATDLDNARLGIGCEDGEWKSMSSEERVELADRLMTEEMQELSKIIGQIKRYALGIKAQRIVNVPIHPYDVEFSDDVLRALPEQFVWLGDERTKVYFYYLWATKRLRVFKRRGEIEVGQGPIEVGIDKSSSMKLKKMGWAMGVAEALRRYASDEDRDYHALFFSSNADRVSFDFPKGKGTWEKVLEFMGTQAKGGTDFDGVLTDLLQRATAHYDATGEGKSDLVFITDGQAELSDQWIADFNAERARIGVRVFSVYIGGAEDMRGKTGPVGLLNRISDVVINVSELRPLDAKAIFEGIA